MVISGSHLIYPKDPPNFGVVMEFKPKDPLEAQDILSAAIHVVFDWAKDGWNEATPRISGTVSKSFPNLVLRVRNFDRAGERLQLRYQHLILALIHLINTMFNRGKFCAAWASPVIFEEPLGQIELAKLERLGQNNATSNDTTVTDSKRISLRSQNQSLTVLRTIVDPDDSDFTIEVQPRGNSMTCTELLSTAFYGLVNAAQAPADQPCRIFMALDPSQKVQLSVFGAPSRSPNGHYLSYDMVRTGLKLLPLQLHSEGACGEVSFELKYYGYVLGGGSIEFSDLPISAT